MILWLAKIILLVMCGAGARENVEGVKMELSLGVPSLTITNPDDSTANYSGLGALAKGFIPVFTYESFRADVTGAIRYLDFQNTANGSQSEYARYLGPGAGMELSWSRLFAGASYYYLKARHTSVGTFSHNTEFAVSGLNYYLGLRFQFGLGALGLGWSQMNATVPGGDVHLSENSEWSSSAYWLQFSYNFKTDTKTFFKSLFGS